MSNQHSAREFVCQKSEMTAGESSTLGDIVIGEMKSMADVARKKILAVAREKRLIPLEEKEAGFAGDHPEYGQVLRVPNYSKQVRRLKPAFERYNGRKQPRVGDVDTAELVGDARDAALSDAVPVIDLREGQKAALVGKSRNKGRKPGAGPNSSE